MTLAFYFTFAAVCLLGAMTPGPSLMVVAKNALAGGRIHGLVAAWAHASAIAVYALFSMTGLTILMQNSPVLFNVILYCGGFYLAYLGIKALSSTGGIAKQINSGGQTSVWQSAREGFLISAFNPKVALFFIALFGQFVEGSQSSIQSIILVATPAMLDGLWFTLIALALSTPKVIQYFYARAVFIDKLSGVILLLLSANILINV